MIIAVLLVLGLCFGSFINALVWRLHEQSLPAKKRGATLKELSISKGRSMCPNCKHTLGALDLLPVISWILLKGRCRYCKHPIGAQYPLVEALTAILFVTSYLFWPFVLNGRGIFVLVVWLIAVVMLVALAVYDLRWMLLPDKIVFPLIALAALQMVVHAALFRGGGWGYLLKAVLSLAVAGGIFYVLYQLSQGSWIGGGDVKLGYALGLLLANPILAFIMLFLASVLGVLAAIPGLLSKKLGMASRLPFGPFLIAATFLTMLFGDRVVNWYVNTLSTSLIR